METIAAVAGRAGVSLRIASSVLNGSSSSVRISAGTRRRVLAAAAELRYAPAASAPEPAPPRPRTLGVVMPQHFPGRDATAIPLFGGLFGAVACAAEDLGMGVFSYPSGVWQSPEISLSRFLDSPCDGLILLYQLSGVGMIPALLNADFPFVLLGDVYPDERVLCVDVDNFATGGDMTNYLLDLGHRRIAIVSPTMGEYFATQRQEGYREALRRRGVTPDPRFNVDGWSPVAANWNEQFRNGVDNAINTVVELMRLPENERPTAIFFLTDAVALGGAMALLRAGWRIPEDITVVGVNDDPHAWDMRPPLTTAAMPYRELGRRAVHMLCGKIRGDAPLLEHCQLLSMQIISRGTSTPPSS